MIFSLCPAVACVVRSYCKLQLCEYGSIHTCVEVGSYTCRATIPAPRPQVSVASSWQSDAPVACRESGTLTPAIQVRDASNLSYKRADKEVQASSQALIKATGSPRSKAKVGGNGTLAEVLKRYERCLCCIGELVPLHAEMPLWSTGPRPFTGDKKSVS
jgi:hypothetical protein